MKNDLKHTRSDLKKTKFWSRSPLLFSSYNIKQITILKQCRNSFFWAMIGQKSSSTGQIPDEAPKEDENHAELCRKSMARLDLLGNRRKICFADLMSYIKKKGWSLFYDACKSLVSTVW